MVDENSKVRDWYVSEFPEDDLGKEIPAELTFYDVFKALDTYKDVYKLLAPADDSVVRERVFQGLAEVMGVDYNYIYDQWLMHESEDKGKYKVCVYDTPEAYLRNKPSREEYETFTSRADYDDYMEKAVDRFENFYEIDVYDPAGEFYGYTMGVDEDGEFIKESSAEDYWDATEIARDGFLALLKFNFGKNARGCNYIITVDANQVSEFYAKDDKEALEKYEYWKEHTGKHVDYDFNNSYKKIVESKDLKESSTPIHASEAMCGFIADLFYNEAEDFSSNDESLTDWCEGGDTFRNASYSEDLCKVLDEMLVKLNPKIQEINAILKEYDY